MIRDGWWLPASKVFGSTRKIISRWSEFKFYSVRVVDVKMSRSLCFNVESIY